MEQFQVVVAGAGPVGLMTALELEARGIQTLIVERNPETTTHPKMDVTNGRSMELLRRLGIAEIIRDQAVPRESPMDVAWVTRIGEWELARFPYPNVHDWRAEIAARNDGSQALEPYMRMSQVVLEPVLRRILLQSPLVEVRYNVALEDFQQDAAGVTVTLADRSSGTTSQVRCNLLAGCDGGGGRVRSALGIPWEGQWNIVRFYMVHYRTPAKDLMRPNGIAWHYQSVTGGTLIAQDDDEIYTLHTILGPEVDPAAIDPRQMLFDAFGTEFPCEILQANAWSPHLVVADSYGSGRVWMAGDAVHQYIPSGGYGMNTGIADAVDLAWKFAAVEQGWGGPALLASIGPERRPVALRNREAAFANMDVRLRIHEAYDPKVHEDSEAGAQARAHLAQRILELGNAENSARGIELGYRYRNSPIICSEPDEPRWDLLEYVASTWPGARAPHVFLETGEPIFDLLGPWFTLLCFGQDDGSPLIAAARQRGVPIVRRRICDSRAAAIYERKLVLVRPDQHVAWRGDSSPADPLAVIDRVRGAGAPSPHTEDL